MTLWLGVPEKRVGIRERNRVMVEVAVGRALPLMVRVDERDGVSKRLGGGDGRSVSAAFALNEDELE